MIEFDERLICNCPIHIVFSLSCFPNSRVKIKKVIIGRNYNMWILSCLIGGPRSNSAISRYLCICHIIHQDEHTLDTMLKAILKAVILCNLEQMSVACITSLN